MANHGGLATAVGVTPDESAPIAFGNEMWFLFVTQTGPLSSLGFSIDVSKPHDQKNQVGEDKVYLA